MSDYLASLGLTPQELNKVTYHRSNMANPGRDKEGRPVTIYSTGIMIPSGKYKGQFVSVPGFVGGKVVEDEDELWKIWQKDINAGKWPIYATGDALNKRDQYVHQVMDYDLMQQSVPAPALMFKDPFGAPDY